MRDTKNGSDFAQPFAVAAQPWRAAWSLGWREWMRFFRQRNRVIGAIGQPILFWLLFGAGMNQVFRVEGQGFSEYFFPGTMLLILLFTAIFSTISIIEDRREGFLQSVLVAPIPRWSMVLGKVLGGSLIAVAQGLVFLLLALTVGIRLSPMTVVAIGGWLLVCSLGLTALGCCLAWPMQSTQGFHAIMNLLLMPMWLLSGAFFPVPRIAAGMSGVTGPSWVHVVMHWVMRLNPVTYAVAGLRQLLYVDMPGVTFESSQLQDTWIPRLSTCSIVVTLFGIGMFYLACRLARENTPGDLL